MINKNSITFGIILTAFLTFSPLCDAQTPRITQTPIKTDILGLTLGAISSEEDIINSLKRETGFSIDVVRQRQGSGIAYALTPHQSSSSYDLFFYAGCGWDCVIVMLDKDNKIYQIGFDFISSDPEPTWDRYTKMARLFTQKYGTKAIDSDTGFCWCDLTSFITLEYKKGTSIGKTDRYYCTLYYFNLQLYNANNASNVPDI